MVLRLTQPLIEMSTMNLPGGKLRPARKADTLSAIFEPMWEPRRLAILWASAACYRNNFSFFFTSFLLLKFVLPYVHETHINYRFFQLRTLKIILR
jgi:hypothetical protein